jgi:hypothetical protein
LYIASNQQRHALSRPVDSSTLSRIERLSTKST